MHRLLTILFVVALIACRNEPPGAGADTKGNATDRSPVNGTSGTGEPRNISTESATSATQLGTTTATMAVTGTEVVHGALQLQLAVLDDGEGLAHGREVGSQGPSEGLRKVLHPDLRPGAGGRVRQVPDPRWGVVGRLVASPPCHLLES